MRTDKTSHTTKLESLKKTDNYFDDKLLKFNPTKVENLSAPTHKRNRQEVERVRHRIKIDEINEMDKTTKDPFSTDSKNIRKGCSKQDVTQGNREGSSDSTSDKSGSLSLVKKRRQTDRKNKIIWIKPK